MEVNFIRQEEIDKLNALSFEIGPIRPPSEAFSLLIRATRNCPWNRCEFCSTYRGQKFQLRPVAEIERDIATAKAICEGIKALADKPGHTGQIEQVAAQVYVSPQFNSSVRSVASWLHHGGKSAFLQDANSLIMRTTELVQVITKLRDTFPSITRITSYGRSKTAAKKSLQELQEIGAAGLSRIHIGMETGHTPLLDFIQKGATGEDHIEGGCKVVKAGISLSEYVMPGLGGKRFSIGHVVDTARVLNAISPDFIRLRSLTVRDGTDIFGKLTANDFQPLSEDETVAEIGELIQRLECHSEVKSDHMMNLLPEVEGKLPEDKPRILAIINCYLGLSTHERLHYRLGRRAGYYEKLEDMENPDCHDGVSAILGRLDNDDNLVEAAVDRLKKAFI